ncbi:Cna protein B-type domain-containing protein, partial [Gracilibacillus orientalis]
MKKFCLLMMTFVLVFTQWGQTILLGNSSGSSTQGIEVTLDPDSTTEQATFNIINENTESEVITFVLPEESSYEEKLTNEQNDESVDFTYSKEDNTILIERDIEEEPITTNFDVVLSQLPNQTSIKVGESDDSLEEFHFTINDPESNEIKETNDEQVDEQVEESEINQEETKNLEEQESSTQEEGTEENNDTEIQQNSTEPSGIITPMAGNLNADIDISPVRSTTLSGNEASYNLVLKLTGSTTNYTNAEIKVDLPITSYTEFTQNVDELTISGVTPVYDEEEHTLTYQFDSLQTGRTYETEIEVDTLNGISPDGAELTANAAFEADQQANISDDAMVAINTSSPMDISKNFKEVVDSDLNLAYPGSTTLWEIKLDIPKNSTGQMYLDENGEISITDTLPDGLSYDSTITGPEPQEDGNSLTWTFDVSTLNEQEQADSELFATTIEVLLTVDEGTEDTTQQNDVSADIPFIDDSTETIEAFDFIDIVDSDSASGDIEGNWYVPNHIGPSDGQGNFGNNQTKNPNPVVYDDALLGFRHGIAPLPESEYGDFEQYTTSYDIDPNLLFKELKTPGGFIYRPNADHPKDVPLENDPVFNILAVVNGTEELLVEDADIDTIYTRSDLGLAEDDEVSMIKYDFTYAPSGMLNVGNPQYFFEVVSGYTGEVRNEFNVFGVDGNGDSFDHHYDEEDLNHIAGPRTAQITDTPTSPPPTAYVGIELLEHHGGEVTSGDNRMRINLNNIDSSSRAMDGPLETAVLLPAGVTLKDDSNPDYIDGDGRSSIETSSAQGGNYEILSDDYNNSGRQLVKVTWNDDLLRVGNGLYAELDVNISEAAPNTLLFDVYGFSGESDLLVPDSTGSAITDTTLQTDEEDLNQNGDTEEPRLKSGNVYSIRGEYNLETEKLVKGELDEEFTYFGQTIPGGQIDYQLKFTNTTGDDISQMTLMDVLPSVGDLGITDNVNRGSMFTPIMTDSIVLPAEWQDKVDVFYSTAKNPERDDLIRHTDYPDTTTQLSNPPGAEAPDWMTEAEVTDWSSIHSFKIEMKEDVDWLEGQDLMIEFTMQAPEASEVDMEVLDSTIDPEQRAAWNSFAMATDHGQPVEPLRVGVYMDLNNSVQLTKIGEEGETLQGAQFTLLNEAGLEIETGLTTDENGILLVEDLLPGTYEFVETQAPEGYQLDETPIPFEIEFAQQEQIELTKENEYVTGSVELTKTGEDGNNLEGVVFELQDAEGETLQENLATDENGVLLIEDLKPGNYQLVETETIAGYELDNTPIEFEIEFGPTEVTEVSFENPLSTGSVELTKVGEEGETLEGAVFTLVDGEGEELETGLTTNEEGILVVEDLKPGNYAFIETEAPFGYQLDATPIEFEIAFDQQEMLSMEVENSLTTGSVELTKIGEDGNNLEGVVFELQNAEGETLQENLVTDENGILLIEDLKPGNYQLVETETIAGYELDSSPIPFEI